jgi:hypothetical protein
MKRFLHVKKLASTNSTDPSETETTDLTDTFTEETQPRSSNFVKISQTNYKPPKTGTKQDNFSKADILKRLEGYVPLRTMEEKKILTQLPTFKTWVRYINSNTKQFRTGGLLMKVSYPDYLTLLNPSQQLTWSVQLKDNIIYIKDPKDTILKKNESDLKEKLFHMYQNGHLSLKRN